MKMVILLVFLLFTSLSMAQEQPPQDNNDPDPSAPSGSLNFSLVCHTFLRSTEDEI